MNALNIYFIEAEQVYPVGSAGAVVIAADPEQALSLVRELYNPKPPIHIGVASAHFKKAKVVMSNSTDY